MKKWYIGLLVSVIVAIAGISFNAFAAKSFLGSGTNCCGDPSAACCPLK